MILVGVDVASEKHDVSIMRDTGEVIRDNFTIPNKESGYKKLLDEIEKAEKLYPSDKVRIGLESTGVYSMSLTEFLATHYEDSVILINPILTSMFELSCHVHYAKTDKTDARGICRFLSKNEDIRPYAIVSYHTRQLRALYRERTKLNKRLNQDINRLKGQLHIAFPELLDKKHATIGLFELEFLSKYPTADSIRNMKPEKLVSAFSKVKYMRIDIARAKKLIEAAKTSIGSSALTEGFVIKETVERIRLYRKQINELSEAMVPLVKEEHGNLLTIPGLGAVTVAGIVGEIGDVSNYHGSDCLVAMAGLNPKVYESGNYAASHTRISKRGSSYLRNALYMAAQSMYMHGTEPIYSFVNKKRKEGKRKVCALDHAARKLCNIIFSMMKTRSEFIPSSANS